MPDSAVSCPRCGNVLDLVGAGVEVVVCPDCRFRIEPQVPAPELPPAAEQPISEDPEASSGNEGDTYQLAAPPTRKQRRGSPAPMFPQGPEPDLPDSDGAEKRPVQRTEPIPEGELDRFGSARREMLEVEVDPPPNRPFVSNVFGFPWQRSVMAQWLFLTVGLTAFVTLLMIMQQLYENMSGVTGVVLAFIGLPAFWIGVWTFSYASACALVVVQETAAGNNEIRDWMEPNWREWAMQLGYVLYLAVLPIAAAWPIIKLSGYTTQEAAIALAVIEFIVFPFALMSALELDSIWVPFSTHIVRSLWQSFVPWTIFYFLSALLVGACVAATYGGYRFAPLAAGVLLGPVSAASMLIYSRLMGRLGWVIVDRAGEDAPKARARELTVPQPEDRFDQPEAAVEDGG